MPNLPRLVLIVNCGSSSLKFTVLPVGGSTPVVRGLAECLALPDARLVIRYGDDRTTIALGGGTHREALSALFAQLDAAALLERIVAVGHRVVHGGERFTDAALITDDVLDNIESVSSLAPLHNPANLLGIRTCLACLPSVPQVAVFDTAFHQTMKPAAFTYAVPQRFYRHHGVRRYGFHGTSYRYVSRKAVRLLGLAHHDHGIVIAHLGNGASVTAVLNGRSVDTSMGLTPLEGLVMGTRCGDIDFGAVMHMARAEGLDIDAIDQLLNWQSGLAGISELSSDCRALEAAADEGHAGATLALDVFVHRLARHIGALATSMPRFDALVFTGGIGENSARIRAMTLRHLGVFGFTVDTAANRRTVLGESGRIDAGNGPVAWVIPTDEEGMIARDATRVAGLSEPGASGPDCGRPSDGHRSSVPRSA